MYQYKSHFFETGPGVEIHYVDEGQGTPLILVPGWTFSIDVFEKQIEYFSSRYRVIAIDPRAHGKSTMTAVGVDHTMHAQDIVRLMKHLDLKDVILVGWSFGAYETWGVVREVGLDNIKGILNIDMSPKAISTVEGDWVEDAVETLRDTIQAIRTPEGFREVLESYTREVMIQRELSDEEMNWIMDCSRMPYYLAQAEYAVAITGDYREEAKLVDQSETCYGEMLVAEHWADVAVPYMNKLCPNTKIHVLGGHMAFWEYAEKFNAILDEFLAKC